jgi:NAD(P)-dependent dehydrogenase (short-subunit alcohol dehydrogenase family)
VPIAEPRVAVVTGGSSGIGGAIARRLAEDGWLCVLLARGEERLRALAEEIGAEYEVCDVSDREAVEQVAETVLARHPRLSLLVCSAGIPGRRGFLRADPEVIEQVVRTNYLGSVWAVRAFLPGLEAAAPSDVVTIVSVAGLVAFPASGPYSAAKHAQLAFSRAITADLRPRGIRVHTVSPGFVETEGFPQQGFLEMPVLGRLVLWPHQIARHVEHVLEHGRRETVVPAWYRIAPLAQALVPGLVHRAVSRARYRKPRSGSSSDARPPA